MTGRNGPGRGARVCGTARILESVSGKHLIANGPDGTSNGRGETKVMGRARNGRRTTQRENERETRISE